MQRNSDESQSSLERVRRGKGIEAMRGYFEKTAGQSREKAAELLNHPGVSFAAFFALIPQIDAYGLFGSLSECSRAAVVLCARTLTACTVPQEYQRLYLTKNDLNRSACEWIFNTGLADDGLDDEFDRMLDVAAARLVRTYGQHSVLPQISRLIFRRNRQGRYVHDLVWALLSSGEPALLKDVAEGLRSGDKRDAELAAKILRQIPDESEALHKAKKLPYSACSAWLNENMPYLYGTGESFHQSSEPASFKVDQAAKYLCGSAELQGQRTLEVFARQHGGRLEDFNSLSGPDQSLLAAYSHRLHKGNERAWGRFMQQPVAEQLRAAKGERGVHHD